MNERIKELAVQAGGGLSCIAEPLEHPWKFSESELVKFAELIVAECILTIQMGITRDGYDTEKYQRSMKHIKQIREHFGVE